jgi:hypothetical protein
MHLNTLSPEQDQAVLREAGFSDVSWCAIIVANAAVFVDDGSAGHPSGERGAPGGCASALDLSTLHQEPETARKLVQ